MKLSCLTVLGLIGFVANLGVRAHSDHHGDGRGCGYESDANELETIQAELAKVQLGGGGGGDRKLQANNYVIQVVFHLLRGTQGNSQALLDWNNEARIRQEIENLNTIYSNSPFSFVLRNTRVTVNDAWAFEDPVGFDALGDEMGAALREGGPTVANIYIGDFAFCRSIAGLARFYFSEEVFPEGTFSREDRVFVCGDAGADTVAHEVGHWLGLEHTFRGNNCFPDNTNDLVEDTPTHAGETQDCPAGLDSCPNLPGLDPINNLMNYGTCTPKSLTPGQNERMELFYNVVRDQVAPCQEGFARLEIAVSFDSFPDETEVAYVPWGTDFQFRVDLKNKAESQVDYSNQRIRKTKCVAADAVHEFIITDPNGLSTGGFYSVKINNNGVVFGGSFNQEFRAFVAGGNEVCASGEKRLQMEVFFGNNAGAITWSIATASGVSVLNSASSYFLGEPNYSSRFAGKGLFVNTCASGEDYVVTVTNNQGSAQAGFSYRVKIDEAVVLTSGDGLIGQENREISSTPAGPISICFAGASTVSVLGKGNKELGEVKIGDKVHIGNGSYEPVYSYGHFAPEAYGDFTEIKTNKSTLTISKDHLVFVESSERPVPAANIVVGDELVGESPDEKVVVQSIRSIVSAKGVFAPLTPSGKIVVDGVLASSFIGFDNSPALTMFGMDFSYQWIARSFEFPHRLVCHHLSQCRNEKYDASGISDWVSLPHRFGLWVLQQSATVQAMILGPALGLFVIFNVLEYLLASPVVLLAVAGTTTIVWRRLIRTICLG